MKNRSVKKIEWSCEKTEMDELCSFETSVPIYKFTTRKNHINMKLALLHDTAYILYFPWNIIKIMQKWSTVY